MSVGLDLGSTQFRSLRYQGGRLIGRTCPVQVLTVPETPAYRKLLNRDAIHYAESEGMLHVIGEAAAEWSELLNSPLQPLLPDGQLPQDDGLTHQLLSLLVEAVLPMARQRGEICGLTIPGELNPLEESPEREFFTRLIRSRGYLPLICGQGHALILAGGSGASFSGLGLNLGATTTEFSLNQNGREIARCAMPWGTQEIQQYMQDVSVEEMGFSRNLQQPLVDFLVELLLEAGSRIGQNNAFQMVTQPITVVCGGGFCALRNAEILIEQAWRRAAWPLVLRTISLIRETTYAAARGCLIQSALESQHETVTAAA